MMENKDKKLRYFDFLYSLVDRPSPKQPPYYYLLQKLHHTRFISLVPNDDNRAKDGEALRDLFKTDQNTSFIYNKPCSVLEMLIGLSYRMEGMMIGEPFEKEASECFWIFLNNLNVDWINDSVYFDDGNEDEIDQKLKIFLNRKYDFNGEGGIFPLKKPKQDQRNVELWYQMNAYLLENYVF